jgi:hypothetical protein
MSQMAASTSWAAFPRQIAGICMLVFKEGRIMTFDDIDLMKQDTKAQVTKKCGLFQRLFAVQTNENARCLIGGRIVHLKGLLVEFAEDDQEAWREKCGMEPISKYSE